MQIKQRMFGLILEMPSVNGWRAVCLLIAGWACVALTGVPASQFTDDFSTYGPGRPLTNVWTITGGQWHLEQGTVVGENCGTDFYYATGLFCGGTDWKEKIFSVRFKIESRGSDWRDGPWFGVNCGKDGDGYYLDFLDRECQLHKVEFGVGTSEANLLARAPWTADQQWHTLRIETKGNQITASLDGRPLLSFKDNAALNLPSMRSGGILLAARKSSISSGKTVVRFDDVQVQFATAPAPATVSLPAGETEERRLFDELTRTLDPGKALALARRGEAAAPFLAKGLEKPGRLASLCAWALWQHPLPATAPSLRACLNRVDQVTGYYAALALGRMPAPENRDALVALLPDERLGFWELSSGSRGRLTDLFVRGKRQSVPAPDWMPNLRVAYAAMEALGNFKDETAAATLLRALDNDQYLIRYGAVRALGRMQWTAAQPVLQKLAANDPVFIVRRAADQALCQIQGIPQPTNSASPQLPPAIVFVKTKNWPKPNLGFRDSYFFPKTPRFHSGENLYMLSPPRPDGVLKNLTGLANGEVQGPEVSQDGKKIIFAMRKNAAVDGFHLFEIEADGSNLRQLTSGNCNDVDPHYLPDGRIVFCSDRAGYQEYYHQERSRVLYLMNSDGTGIEQITFNPNQDYDPLPLRDGRILYTSYRFYAQDGSEGPLRGEYMGLARIETVLRVCQPDGTADRLFYGSMRGSFYCPLRPMPFSDQFAGWHRRGYHVGVVISQPREMEDGRIVCISPAGLTLVEPDLTPVDCEAPVFPEVMNLSGGEEVYIHVYDEMNPVGRYTSPYPLNGDWILVSHAPWTDLGGDRYGLYLFNVTTREKKLVYDDPQYSEVMAVPVLPHPPAQTLQTTRPAKPKTSTGFVYCNSVFNSDLPYDRSAVKYVRVIEGMQMGLSVAANAAFRTRVLGTAPVHPDGSFYVEVPADTPFRFQLLDAEGRMLVHETEFNYVRPGETKGCIGCHEPSRKTAFNLRPQAMNHPAVPALRKPGDLIYFGRDSRPYNLIFRE